MVFFEMDHHKLSRNLLSLASQIEKAKKPSRFKVSNALNKIILSIDGNDEANPPVVDPNTGFTVPVVQVIAHLTEWQSAKYTIDILYRNFADRITGPWRDAVYEHWYEHAKEERENAYNLSMKIISLGGDPVHSGIEFPSQPKDLNGFFQVLKDLEIKAIGKGKTAIEYSGQNDSLRIFAEEIISIDSHHLDDLIRMSAGLNV